MSDAFKAGDQVFGLTDWSLGAHAEYKCLPEDGAVTTKPANTTYEEAAAIPFGAGTAFHFLRKGNIQSGQKVLIYGASGSLGTYAVQLAKHYFDAEVTGVCSTANLEMVQSLGADHVIDYTQEDFAGRDQTYDIIFDTVGKTTYSRCKDSLSQNGYYLAAYVGIATLLQMLRTSMMGSRRVVTGIASIKTEDLSFLRKLVEAEK